MVKTIGQVWFGLICLLAGAGMVEAATATASLDRSSTGLGESVQLSILVKGDADQDPDFSVLQHDFDIISQSQSSNYSLINGSLSRSKEWRLVLMPKHAGELHIPPISLGNVSTQPLVLQVSQQVPATAGNRQVFLEMSAVPVDVYVQAQVLVTVKLYRTVNLTQAELSEPQAQHAVVRRLGEDKNYQVVRNQRRYWVTQRRYAVFPQQSGALHLDGVVLNAQIEQGIGLFRQGGRVIRVQSPAVDIQVNPMPPQWDVQHPWLPASDLTLEEIPDAQQGDTLKVGEPMTRTFEIRAHGLTAEQLPAIVQQGTLDGWKLYPDKPELKTEVDAQGVVGIRREKIAMIPTKSGETRLPPIQVVWWNTTSGKVEKATVLGRVLHVQPSASQNKQGTTATPAPKTQLNPAPAPAQTEEKMAQTSPSSQMREDLLLADDGVRLWQGVSAVLLVLWLLTLVWFKRGSIIPKASSHDEPQDTGLKEVRRKLRRACRHGQAHEVMQALLTWGKAAFPEKQVTHVAQLRGISQNLDQALDDLEYQLYSADGAKAWDAMVLWQAVESLNAGLRKAEHHQQGEILKAL